MARRYHASVRDRSCRAVSSSAVRRSIQLTPRRVPEQGRSQVLVDALLIATKTALLEQGYHDLNTTEIARVAGVSVGSLYQYFPNKESLIAALLLKLDDDALCYLAENLLESSALALEDLSYLIVLASIRTYADDRALWSCLLASSDEIGAERKRAPMEAKWHELFAGVLAKSVPQIDAGRRELSAYLLRQVLRSSLERIVSERPSMLDDPRLADELTELVWGYLRRDG
jgi:AcrR family transcriptional regulator